MDDLIVDPRRANIGTPATGILVRARNGTKWGNYDIADLDAQSLLKWLRSRGGKNEWAENTLGLILGHGNIATEKT